ncbi:PQQ-like beta-propeller repeat protein [Streptomyces sp. DSM 40750]|uniref:PQQ-like beta-propeller repeat protein n=1 Tax=Streptomyces sp. DSM 40750 TaxID=2801030 RepID=UPI00214CF3AE|nr:PQQ-like beta-propeller repeat protein [Streptomyces sp. DSM 40750]UUU21051.1 PQQ-like beta-propeller repeat protein [Streptomyces sp. DSM 40750]
MRSRLLVAPLALLLAAPVLLAAHQARPAPYGDRFTLHARVEYAGGPRPRTTRAVVTAYAPESGRLHWTHARPGRRPLEVLPVRGHVIALWDDGLVTDTGSEGVRWHRAVPGAADRPRAGARGRALRLLGPRMLAVVTPGRVTAYRLADGDLRWVLPAREGCAFEPGRAVRRGPALLVAQPCTTDGTSDPDPDAPWTSQLVAVDDLGRITPDRRPLGNDLP